jgi:hypothetical protein
MPLGIALCIVLFGWGVPSLFAQDAALETVLRAQMFDKAFEGFDHYHVTIEEDLSQADGTREVTAVASARFLENTKRMKVLFLIVGEQVIGGQLLEGTDLPPCVSFPSSSL